MRFTVRTDAGIELGLPSAQFSQGLLSRFVVEAIDEELAVEVVALMLHYLRK